MHILLALFLVPCTVLTAQTVRGSITGRVTDSADRAVSGASVTVTEEQTGRVRRTAASIDGEFSIALLPAGLYRIEAQSPGLQSAARTINLLVNQEVHIELAGIEPCDRTDAAFAGHQTVEALMYVLAEAGHPAEPRDHHTPSTHGLHSSKIRPAGFRVGSLPA